MMQVLIGCEFSAVVRDAFIAKGHDAWSCDLLPTEGRQGNHLIGNIRWAIEGNLFKFPNAIDIRTGNQPLIKKWDLAIFHPDCQFLTNSGVRWLFDPFMRRIEERWKNLETASNFFKELMQAPIEKICIENPIPHKHANLPPYNQKIQPWQFGHKEMKATCFWLKNLPFLIPTDIVGPPPTDIIERRKWAKVHRAQPGPDRWKERSRTLLGIAAAMAEQWGT